MSFSYAVVVKTFDIERLVPKGNKKLQLTARIEISKNSSSLYSCKVWFLESYRLLPTIHAINDAIDQEDMHCDKDIFTVEDTLNFESIVGSSVDFVECKVVSALESLFIQAEL